MLQKGIYRVLLFLLSVHCCAQERYVISCEGMSECKSAGRAWFVAGGGVSGAGGRAYWAWLSGEGWVFICLEPM